MDLQSAYEYLKTNEIYPEDIWDFIENEETSSEWFYEALLKLNDSYDILSDNQYPEELDAEDLLDEIKEYFGYDQETLLEEFLNVAPENKVMEDFIILAAGYGLEL